MNFLQTYSARAALAATLVAVTAMPVAAQNYQVTELPTPEQGNAVARGLNNLGKVAGRSGTNFSTQTSAFVSRGGQPFELIGSFPRGHYSSAFGINDLD